MKFVIPLFLTLLPLHGNPGFEGAWQSTSDTLSCMCGHKTQLVIRKGEGPDQYIITQYLIGHSRVSSIGEVEYKDDTIKSSHFKFTAKIKINEKKDRIAFRDIRNKYPWIFFTKISKKKFDFKIADSKLTEESDISKVRPFLFFRDAEDKKSAEQVIAPDR